MQLGQQSSLSTMTVLDYLESRVRGFGDDLVDLGKLTLTEVEDRLDQIDTHGELSVSLDDDPIRRDDIFTCLVFGQYMDNPEGFSDLPIQTLFDNQALNSTTSSLVRAANVALDCLRLEQLSGEASLNPDEQSPENLQVA